MAGLSVYAYVPLRSPMAQYVWGQPDSWQGFVAYLTASDSYGIVAAESGDRDAATEQLRMAQKYIDKAAAKGLIHKNTAARRKARLTKQVDGLLG